MMNELHTSLLSPLIKERRLNKRFHNMTSVCTDIIPEYKASNYTEPKRLDYDAYKTKAEVTSVTHPSALCLVSAGRYIPTMSCPIGMDKLSRTGQQLIGVCTEVISLGLFKHTIQVI
jgi:hypothetical protein